MTRKNADLVASQEPHRQSGGGLAAALTTVAVPGPSGLARVDKVLAR